MKIAHSHSGRFVTAANQLEKRIKYTFGKMKRTFIVMKHKEKEIKNQTQPKDKFDVLVFKTFKDYHENKDPKVYWEFKNDRPIGYPKNPEREEILKGIFKRR